MRIIDVDDFYKPFKEGKKTLEAIGSVLPEELLDAVLKIYDEIKERLDATPTVDAVEVVRCKECKYASPNGLYGCLLERFSALD